MRKGLPTQPQEGNLRSLWCHSASRMHNPEPERERTSERRSTIMELLQPAGNDDHAEFRFTASTIPASNEELCDTCHLPEPTHLHLFSVPQSDQEIKSESNLYHLWSIPSSGLHQSAKTRERENICDGCRERSCWDTAQSPSTSTVPSRNHPTPSQISESTMLQDVPIIHPKTQVDRVAIRPILQNTYDYMYIKYIYSIYDKIYDIPASENSGYIAISVSFGFSQSGCSWTSYSYRDIRPFMTSILTAYIQASYIYIYTWRLQPTAGRGLMLSLHNQDPTGGVKISMLVMKGLISR